MKNKKSLSTYEIQKQLDDNVNNINSKINDYQFKFLDKISLIEVNKNNIDNLEKKFNKIEEYIETCRKKEVKNLEEKIDKYQNNKKVWIKQIITWTITIAISFIVNYFMKK